jgi:hypothetical protein
VKTTGVDGAQRGYDGGKKVKGSKRHLLVDTEELVLKAKVHSAKVPDQEGIKRSWRASVNCARAFRICGWMLVIGAKRKAEAGWRRSWGGPWISSNVRANLLRRKF